MPSNLIRFVRSGCACATPGVVRISRSARVSSCVPTTVSSSMSQCAWFQTCVGGRGDVLISASTASSVPTASAICATVVTLRRPRRVTLRTPICAVRGRKESRRSARSSTAWPPCRAATSSSPSRTGIREPRRIAGRAASGGAKRPTMMLAATTGRDTSKPGEIAKKLEPKKRTTAFAIRTPSPTPITDPAAPSSSAVRR